VDFFVNGSLVGTDTNAPYSVGWSTGTTGTYTLTARATDNAGAGTTSGPVSIAVRRRGGHGSSSR
jgi:chitinase